MDLLNNKIKMKYLLSNSKAKAVLFREFPEFANPFMLRMAESMTLEQVLKLAQSRFSKNKLENVISELKAL